jgi:hypothetical protein
MSGIKTTLNKINVTSTSKILREILIELNINFNDHQQFLNSLCSSKLTRITDTSARKENVSYNIPIEYKNANTLDAFFNNPKNQIIDFMSANNIHKNDISSISENYDSDVDQGTPYSVDLRANVLEPKATTRKRVVNAKRIDTLLNNFEEIYLLAEKKLDKKNNNKSKLANIQRQISSLQKEANEIEKKL